MTLVKLEFSVPAPTGTAPAGGALRWTPTRRRIAYNDVVVPAGFQVALVNGVAEIEVAPTDNRWVWRVDEAVPGSPVQTRYVAVPDVEESDYTALVEVDPETLVPVDDLEPAWYAYLNVLEDRAGVAYDLALESRDAAEAARDSATGSQASASASAVTATTKANEAGASATAAAGSAVAALDYSNDAAESADLAGRTGLNIGTVQTVDFFEDAAATITGANPDRLLNLFIPHGPANELEIGTVETVPGTPLDDEIVAEQVLNGVETRAALDATYATKAPAGTLILDGTPHMYTDPSRPLYPVKEVVVLGDSYAASDGGIIPTNLSTSLGITTYNYGVGGMTTTDNAIRVGGVIPAVTFTGGVIPADTTAVAVTVQPSGDYINAGPGGNPFTYTGTLAGIPGTLTYSTALSTWSFSRTTAGSQTTIPANTPFLVTTPTHREKIFVILNGFNNRFSSVGDMRNILRDIDAVIGALTPIHKRYIVSGHFTTVAETAGTSGYNMTVAANLAKAEHYGPLYYDIRRAFIDEGLALAGLTPTTADLNAIAADTVPPSLMNPAGDHPNATGYSVMAKLYGRHIGAMGWGLTFSSINKLTADQASFEASVVGWGGNGDGDIVISRSTLQAAHGTASMRVTAAPSGIANAVMTTAVAVTPGQHWAASIESRAETTPRQRNVDMYWYNSSMGFLAYSPGAGTTDTSTGWTRHTKTGTVAPANAAFLRIGLATTGAVAGERHYIDKAGAYIVGSAGAAVPTWELP